MNLKKKEDQKVDSLVHHRKGNKILKNENMEKIVEQRLNENQSRDYHTWGSIPYTVTKPRYYCGGQEVLADRILI